jgi:hypothetical protein
MDVSTPRRSRGTTRIHVDSIVERMLGRQSSV